MIFDTAKAARKSALEATGSVRRRRVGGRETVMLSPLWPKQVFPADINICRKETE
jgi:hypothetical protein